MMLAKEVCDQLRTQLAHQEGGPGRVAGSLLFK